MISDPDIISNQYSYGDLAKKILSALKKAGKDLKSLKRDNLAGLDEIHVGGHRATQKLASKIGLVDGQEVLDVGSGLGGPARYLAAEFGCKVTGIDLTEEFCQIAEMLTEAVGLSSLVRFRHGDALQIPFAENSSDIIWSQHCSMNVPDKKSLFAEFWRVLRNKGKLAIHDITAGPIEPIHFPVPWARDPSISFLLTAEQLRSMLSRTGFKELHWKDISQEAIEWYQEQKSAAARGEKPLLGQQLVYGNDLVAMGRNVKKNLLEERIRIFESIWLKNY